MQFVKLIVLCAASLGAVVSSSPAPQLRRPAAMVARQAATPTQCTASAVATTITINRGNEGIWVVKANQTGLNQLYVTRQVDWLANNHTAILDTCTSICLAGNSTETPGTWLPSGEYFEGAFVNTPGGSSSHPLWQCACYDRTLSQDDLTVGGGVGELLPKLLLVPSLCLFMMSARSSKKTKLQLPKPTLKSSH